jgi:hypothetical protein
MNPSFQNLPIDHILAVLIKAKYIDVLLISLSVVSLIIVSILRQKHSSVQITDLPKQFRHYGKEAEEGCRLY